MKTALITGANGFIGSYLCNALTSNGVKVYAVVRERSDNIKKVENVVIVRNDDNDMGKLEKKIDADIDCFYHFAWEGVFTAGDALAQVDNIAHTCKMVMLADRLHARKFIFSGTVMEYSFSSVVASQGSQPGLRNLYYSAKQASNLMAKTLCFNYGIPYIEAAITNAYGPGSNRNSFMNGVLTKMINNEPIKLTKGLQSYDFIYITDLAAALQLLGEKGEGNRKYYVGSNNPLRICDYVNAMKEYTSSKSDLLFGEINDSPIGLDVSKFKIDDLYEKLGFEQKVSLEEGINHTVSWLKMLDI